MKPEQPKETLHKLEAVEREYIERVLKSVQGNRTHAAEILGIHRRTLQRKIARYSGYLFNDEMRPS